MKYMPALANKGWKQACQDDLALAKGINTHGGNVYYKGVAEAFNYELHDLSEVL